MRPRGGVEGIERREREQSDDFGPREKRGKRFALADFK
jgi:hypothetical protein